MRKLVSFMHISVDGFAARSNGSMEGTGIPLFRGNATEIKLQLIETFPFSSGVVCLHYSKF